MRRAFVVALAAGLLAAVVPPASAQSPTESAELRRAVTVEGVLAHERELQRIADRNLGNRAAGTAGYEASARYVARRLRLAGYRVTVQPFQFPFFQQREPARLSQVAPVAKEYDPIVEFGTITYSGSGDVTAPVQAVDLQLPPGPTANSSTSGCEAADFAGFTPGRIALIQRGTCLLRQKALNAQAAGALGVIIFNEGQPGRTDKLIATLSEPGVTIPVLGASFALGQELATASGTGVGVTVRVFTSTFSESRRAVNVLGDTRGGRADRVVVAGAHLDSVPAGPGINDNGSGSSTILEIAEQMAALVP